MSAAGSPEAASGHHQRGAPLRSVRSSGFAGGGACLNSNLEGVACSAAEFGHCCLYCFGFVGVFLWPGEEEVRLWGMGSREPSKL